METKMGSRTDFSTYTKYVFWSIIIGFALYRSLAWVNYFTKSYDPGLAMDFKNIYIASKNLSYGKDPYNATALAITWQEELTFLKTSFLNPPGEKDQPVLYPPWALWMFLPFTHLPFDTAVPIFLFFLFLSIGIVPWLIQKCIQGTFHWGTYLSILLFLAAFKGLKMSILFGQPSLLVFALGLGAWYALKKNNWLVAGVLLGISSIKPSISIVFYLLFLTFWLNKFKRVKSKQISLLLTLVIGCLIPALGLVIAQIQERELSESIVFVYIQQLQSFSDWFYLRDYNENFYLEHTTNLRALFTYWNLKGQFFGAWVEPILILVTLSIGIRKKVLDQWTDARLLATMIAAFLSFSYHLYYELAWLVIIFFPYKNEMTPPFQWLVLLLCLPDFLIGMEKITPFLPTILGNLLQKWNCVELPIRMLSLWFLLVVYPTKKPLGLAS